MAKPSALGGGIVKKGGATPAQVQPAPSTPTPVEQTKSAKPVANADKPTVALTVKLTEAEHSAFLMALIKAGKKRQQPIIRELITEWAAKQ